MRKASENIRAILAENLRNMRHSRNLTQEELAMKCGLHRTYIGSVERCERNVTLSTLEMLATVFEISIPELLSKKSKTEDDNAQSHN